MTIKKPLSTAIFEFKRSVRAFYISPCFDLANISDCLAEDLVEEQGMSWEEVEALEAKFLKEFAAELNGVGA